MFRVLVAFGVAAALRPENNGMLDSTGITATLSQLTRLGPDVTGSLAAMEAAETATMDFVHQSDNATKHMSNQDKEVLQGIIDVILGPIYSSMESSHQEEKQEMGASLAVVSGCNSGIAARLADDGDIGGLRRRADQSHSDMTRIAEDMEAKTKDGDTKRSELEEHKEQAPPAPACSNLPTSKTDAAWDAYFESSAHAAWFQTQQATYLSKREAVTQAEQELSTLTNEYERTQERLNPEYCDWKSTLTAGCDSFNTCYENATVVFDDMKKRLQSNMDIRIKAYTSGETIVAHIKVLLGSAATAETEDIDVSRFSLTFPETPERGACDLAELAEPRWDSLGCQGDGRLPAPEPKACVDEVSASVHGTMNFGQGVTVVEGVAQFNDRNYVLTKVPSYLLGATLFPGPCHHFTGNTIKINVGSCPRTVYFLFSKGNQNQEIVALTTFFSSWQSIDEPDFKTNSFGTKGFKVWKTELSGDAEIVMPTNGELSIVVL